MTKHRKSKNKILLVSIGVLLVVAISLFVLGNVNKVIDATFSTSIKFDKEWTEDERNSLLRSKNSCNEKVNDLKDKYPNLICNFDPCNQIVSDEFGQASYRLICGKYYLPLFRGGID